MKLPFAPITLSRRGLPEMPRDTSQYITSDAAARRQFSVVPIYGQRQCHLIALASFGARLAQTSIDDNLFAITFGFRYAVRCALAQRAQQEGDR